ncbi:hypothetical protein RKLH11_3856 [Rhodobacteraceae bacterium KLH11]|nr:hypothetical protein RKLH11_3856 [Rhodobacteraceae bacterium KLH11]
MAVAPYDEEEIGSDDTIIRRISPEQHVVWDDNRGCNRISKKAYSKSSGENGGMSVDIEALIVADAEDPASWVTSPRFTGSVCFSAHQIRELDLIVGYDPIKDELGVPDNPYHGEVWTSEPSKRFSNGQQKGLLKAAEWYVELEDVEIR